MRVDADRTHRRGTSGTGGTPFALDRAVADVYSAHGLTPLLHSLLEHSAHSIGSVAGSISVVDWEAGRYSKLAERGVHCRLGQAFPLDEGATGAAVSRRRPVVIDSYARLRGGHLPAGHPATDGAAVAVPIWWRGELIGVNVAFTGERRRFGARELDALELLTEAAAGAIVAAGAGDPVLGRSRSGLRARLRPNDLPLAGDDRPLLGVADGSGSGQVPERSGQAADGVPASPLTPREREVLHLLAEGIGDRAVAERLVLSPKTVEKHVAAVLRKTGTSSRTGAVVVALRRGWLAA
ncbi:LuxR C-terminal-related transcriptional regulator [Actinotalea sp. Marseille-Q4924]|uniref:LuxR C-terminal-related transcriptional regulator n=1 Tax=Actinotalea sp. Marseille-Q4924 TaxID=2866571 RepID=UPI001CE3BC7E|nr:LuxR C-terminal-related transcriptional regulator [Actinotalea sp. Marseille-Q4924]